MPIHGLTVAGNATTGAGVDRVSRKQIAAQWGVTTQRIDALVKEGRLRPDAKGLILQSEVDEVRATLNPANVAKEREAKALGGQRLDEQDRSSPITKARIAEAVFRAKQRELIVKQMSGALVDRSEVRVQGYEAGRAFQQTMLAFPDRLSAEIATSIVGLEQSKIEAAIRVILDREVRRVLGDLVKSLEGVAAAEAE